MTILLIIPAIVMGAFTGICLYRFHQNGLVPCKYLEDETSKNHDSLRENNNATSDPFLHQGKRKIYKAFAFFEYDSPAGKKYSLIRKV